MVSYYVCGAYVYTICVSYMYVLSCNFWPQREWRTLWSVPDVRCDDMLKVSGYINISYWTGDRKMKVLQTNDQRWHACLRLYYLFIYSFIHLESFLILSLFVFRDFANLRRRPKNENLSLGPFIEQNYQNCSTTRTHLFLTFRWPCIVINFYNKTN